MRRNVSRRVGSVGGGWVRLTSTCCTVAQEEAPSGMIARGHYNAVSKFLDDDDHTHLQFEWSFDIAKDW